MLDLVFEEENCYQTILLCLHVCYIYPEVFFVGILKNKDRVPEEEENFDEAIKATNMALVPTRVRTGLL